MSREPQLKPELLGLFAITFAIQGHDVAATGFVVLAVLTATDFPFEALFFRKRRK